MKSKTIESILEIQSQYDVDINYGLAPNPFGFTFIVNDDMPYRTRQTLDRLLGSLGPVEEDKLREILFG